MKRRLLILVIVCLVGMGCESLMHGPTQEIKITSNPPGALVVTEDFNHHARTPCVFLLPRSNSTILTSELMGYERMSLKVKCDVSLLLIGNSVGVFTPLLWFDNIPINYLLFMGDITTGSVGVLTPNEVHFEMVKK